MRRAAGIFVVVLFVVPVALIGIGAALGLQRAVIVTGSMAPTYPVGAMTFVQPLDPDQIADLNKGNVIMFWSPDDTTVTVTHRIAEVRPSGFVTKGDANNIQDPWLVPQEMVIGQVRGSVPLLGRMASALQDGGRAPVVVAACAAIFILNELASIVRELRREPDEDDDEPATATPVPVASS